LRDVINMSIIDRMSPLNQRRWQQFTYNRRGYISLWLFSIILVLCLGAELVANDKPLVVSYNNEIYLPTFNFYPETTFGGDLETQTDFKDPFVANLINKKGWMLWPVIRYSFDTHNYFLETPAPSAPTSDNYLGTDDQARDVLARLIYGFRVSVLFGLTLTIVCSVIGVLVGAAQGFYGGKVDLIGQRLIEIWSGLPALYMLIIMSSIIQPSFFWFIAIMVLFSWMTLVGVVRAECLRGRNLEYVKAAQALGVKPSTIMVRHVLPNAMVATLTMMPFILTGAITSLTALDFLGLGLPADQASLGEMLRQGKENLHAPWLAFTGFTALALMLSLLVFIGEGVRDAFDPRKTLALDE
jgi:microcin C transport system permease protein